MGRFLINPRKVPTSKPECFKGVVQLEHGNASILGDRIITILKAKRNEEEIKLTKRGPRGPQNPQTRSPNCLREGGSYKSRSHITQAHKSVARADSM